ncbi:hypothetical protein AH68_04145 [Bifidobacterium catenulatum PV20-2]|uniref:Uncharacterized protein n=1 Tax=Bifidobacterium catenulatum PV20-2 TaxID=1447716 RepID=A0A0A7I573_9BIFI|nr:hypothetical protein AH68_04145 [Bifidobacterium catenulatum PV20-2]
MGVRIYPKRVDARFLSLRARQGRFKARETQIELNGLFDGLRMAFSQVVWGVKNPAVLIKMGVIRGNAAAFTTQICRKRVHM